MNSNDPAGLQHKPPQHVREFLDLFDAVEGQDSLTQRSLADRIGIAVGLANALVKRAVRKGYVKMSQAPVRRYAYYLTPEGFAEKSRLISEYLSISLSFFRRARREYLEIFEYCNNRKWSRIVFAGTGELAEIALIAAHEANIEIIGVIDPESNRDRLMGLPVFRDLAESGECDAVIITNARAPFKCYEAVATEVATDRILAPALLRLPRLRLSTT